MHDNLGDPKNTWKVLNDLIGKKSAVTEISELVTSSSENGLSNAKDIADHFNEHFTQIGPDVAANLSASTTNPEDYSRRHSTTFQLSEIKSSRVLKLLLKLDVSKATSLDQISSKIIKLAGPFICNQLTDLFNLSIKSGVFPNDWKLAKVSPINKTGERNDANNYSPISVLPTIARIFEKLIYEQLYDYLCKNDILDSRQSGLIQEYMLIGGIHVNWFKIKNCDSH